VQVLKNAVENAKENQTVNDLAVCKSVME
jgi:hypothetical protein